MSSFVNICCKLDTNSKLKLNKLVINDFKISVKTLSELVSKEFHLNEDNFDLLCFGQTLSLDQTIDSYEITNGTTVFVINKNHFLSVTANADPKATKPKSMPNQSDIQHMVIALRTALMDASFRQMLDKLSEYEFRENLMAVTPGLREDPTCFAILQDPELLTTLTEPTNIHRVLDRHPCLLDAATNLSATFHEEIIANESSSGPSSAGLLNRGSSAFSYSLDAISDDEDMDDTEESPSGGNTSNPTAQRIAELMVRAYQANQGTGSQSTSRSGVITQDMLRQALQQSGPSTATSPTAPTPTTQSTPTSQPSTSVSSTAARLRSFSSQLQQMRDLGITDDIVAIQALEATNGDIQAAIDIIFSDNN